MTSEELEKVRSDLREIDEMIPKILKLGPRYITVESRNDFNRGVDSVVRRRCDHIRTLREYEVSI